MKKLILILITLTTLTNVSYASFPVTESLQTEVVESATIINTPESSAYMIIYLILGFFVGLFSWFLLLLPLLLLFGPNKSFRIGIIAGFLVAIPFVVLLLLGGAGLSMGG